MNGRRTEFERINRGLRRRSKGQMFLLGALVIVSILVILRYNVSYPSAIEEKKVLENRFESEMFINLIEEFNNTLRFSYKEPLNIGPNVFDFANFTEKKIIEHSIGFKFLFIGSVANKTTGSLNVTLINMLDKKIDADLELDGQSDSNQVQNYGVWEPVFSITPGTEYTLNLTYDSYKESIPIKTKKNKDVYIGFFYILLEGDETVHIARYQKTMNLQN